MRRLLGNGDGGTQLNTGGGGGGGEYWVRQSDWPPPCADGDCSIQRLDGESQQVSQSSANKRRENPEHRRVETAATDPTTWFYTD